jgi:hypothetical protein
VVIFLAVRKWCEASRKNVAISLRVAISSLLREWLFSVAIFVTAIRGIQIATLKKSHAMHDYFASTCSIDFIVF